MKCPVCSRNLAPTLSICLTCGTMMNDSVREELQTKVAPISGPLNLEVKPLPPMRIETVQTSPPEFAPPPTPAALTRSAEPAVVPAPVPKRIETAGLNSPKTSPTLVDFQNRNASLPDWRLQMQNAVRQRRGESAGESQKSVEPPVARPSLSARGSAALKAQPVAETPEIENADPRLAAALRRLSESRKAYLPAQENPRSTEKLAAAKSFPFNIVTATPNPPIRSTPEPLTQDRPKPAMVTPLRMEKKLDTNKLPKIDAIIPEAPDSVRSGPSPEIEVPVHEAAKVLAASSEFSEVHRIVINAENHEEEDQTNILEDDIEDLAPFSMRFNAGLFDLIIGAFASMVVLSPVALAGGNWLTAAGLLTFAGTWAICLFLYMTVCIGFFGKTMGMRLFSLELVDAEANEYPTLRQAAVSASLFIISLATGGAGFLTVFFNEENRALHDLVSGTIIVREF